MQKNTTAELSKPIQFIPLLPSGTTTEMIKAAAANMDVPSDIAIAICKVGTASFRDLPELDAKLAAKKAAAIGFSTHGGADLGDLSNDRALQACAQIAVGQFKGLTSSDIAIAFDLAAAGKLGVSVTCFGGRVQASVFGQLLVEYKKYRTSVLQGVQKSAQAAQDADEAKKRNEKGYGLLKGAISDFKAKKCEWHLWSDVPLGLYEALKAESIVEDDGEIWVQTKKDVAKSFLDAQKFVGGYSDHLVGDAIACRKLARDMQRHPDLFPTELLPRAKAWYKKRLVFQAYQKHCHQTPQGTI